MSRFTKTEIIETVIEPSALERYEDCCKELAASAIELKAAEVALRGEFGICKDPRIRFIRNSHGTEMHTRVNAAQLVAPEVRACERRWAEAFRKFQQKLIESAELKRAAGPNPLRRAT
jgi:hypothetical protein